MNTLINRLREEKFEEGKAHGREWAESAHYDDIEWVLDSWNPEAGDDPTRLNSGAPENLDEFFREIINSDPAMGFDIAGQANKRVDRLVAGFKKGVQEIWNEVEPKL